MLSVDRSMLMSELDGVSVLVDWLLPPDVMPPLLSLVAPVVTTTGLGAFDVGVPETVHEMEAPMATVAGVAGTQPVTVTPAGNPATEQEALMADAVAVALLVHLMVPL